MHKEKLDQLEAQIAHLGQIQPQIPRQTCIDIILSLLKNFSDQMHDPQMSKDAYLGQLMTISTLLATSTISEQTKMEAHSLVHQATQWSQGQLAPEQLHHSLDHLIHDLSLLIG